ncbi:MAG TPA: hypothetical protein PLU37_05285 [Chitinophagaceae bacterium]|nr:hypothetical protein [Chitinophagaceae bacterium]MCB9054952.1 hypothetical protein [Chitinophagales bacterium]HPG10922.1 hypothetical protein [Chitinophagaceae bacterium]HRX93219.1 hypothetical protein [Chitinophagaceae bacterium]
MASHWDPEVKEFFIKIIKSISYGLMWIMASATAGLYYELGYANGKPVIYTVIFYCCMIVTLWLLIRYLIRIWK